MKLTELGANKQTLGFLIEQHNGAILQMKIITNDCENLIEDLVQVEGGQHRLTRVVKNGNPLHNPPNIQFLGNLKPYYITGGRASLFCVGTKVPVIPLRLGRTRSPRPIPDRIRRCCVEPLEAENQSRRNISHSRSTLRRAISRNFPTQVFGHHPAKKSWQRANAAGRTETGWYAITFEGCRNCV